MRQRIGHDPDLNADRLVLDLRCKMLDLGPGDRPPLGEDGLREPGAADETRPEEPFDLERGNEADDRGESP